MKKPRTKNMEGGFAVISAITGILIAAVGVVSFYYINQSQLSKQKSENLESAQPLDIPEDASTPTPTSVPPSWIDYTKEALGFKIKYPRESGDPLEFPEYVMFMQGDVRIMRYEATEESLADWIKKNEKCGDRDADFNLDMTKVTLEDYTLAGVGALRVQDLGVCPPGATELLDSVYAEYDGYIYLVSRVIIAGNDWWRAQTKEDQRLIFYQMVSTFEFTD